ncbi:MAG: type III pantothenate kinase [Acidobacteriota bacterium]
MLLALDVGNTNITIGAFENTASPDSKLVGRWRLRTIHEQTADEWGVLLRNLFSLSGLDLAQVDGVIISSVVPAVDQPLEAMSQRYFKRQPMFVTPASDLGMPVRYDNPREVGADRLVNSIAAFAKYGGPCVVVDFGTTINFDVVSAKGEFLGGVICPGIGMSISGLFARTARLPMVDFREPEKLIGSNTVGSITSGLYYGFIGMIDGILERIMSELGPSTKTVATGGQGHVVTEASQRVKLYDQDLTLDGLRMIWNRSSSPVRKGGDINS